MSRRRWVALGLVVVLVIGVGFVVNRDRDAKIGRDGSVALPGGQPVELNRVPAAYRVDYRVSERVGGKVRMSTQKVWVRRPFDSRVELFEGAPPGRSRLSVAVATLGRGSSARPRAETSRIEQPPDVAAADVRMDVSQNSDLVERRERRRVLGRVCQVFRTGSALSAPALRRPTAAVYTDACVDRDGTVLEELSVARGDITGRRVAVRVDLAPTLTDAMFAVGAPNVTVPNGGGSTRAVAPTSSPPGTFWRLDALDGFTLVGRYSVVPPQPENFTDQTREGFRRGGISDVYRRGSDAIVIDQGATLRAQPPWTVDPANPSIDLGPLGQGEVLFTARGAEVRALTGAGHYVRVFGTVSPDALAAIARQLHQVPGTQLVYLN